MLKVVHQIGEARETSKNNGSIAERDPKHPYDPAHALKDQEDLHKQPIPKIFERWPRYSPDDFPDVAPYTPCFGTPTPPKGCSKKDLENIKYGVVVADLKINDGVKTYFKSKNHLIISVIKEKDIIKLKKLIENYINLNLVREESSIMINERHYQLLKKVKDSLINVKNNIKNKSNTDLLAMDVKYALNHLGEITGEITNDDILGNIFSKFCIGK